MRHVVRNALIPIVTVAALNFGGAARRRDRHRDGLHARRHRLLLHPEAQQRRPVRRDGVPARHVDRSSSSSTSSPTSSTASSIRASGMTEIERVRRRRRVAIMSHRRRTSIGDAPAPSGSLDARRSAAGLEIKARSQWDYARRRFLRHRLAMVGLFGLVIIFGAGIFAGYVAPYSFSEIDLNNILRAPTTAGTTASAPTRSAATTSAASSRHPHVARRSASSSRSSRRSSGSSSARSPATTAAGSTTSSCASPISC